MGNRSEGLYLLHLSIHGLIRSKEIEMGVNPDTGGQVGYVIELCKELGIRHEISRTDLITRLIRDDKLSEDYARPTEMISERSRIVRLPFGPDGYQPKEKLWPYLDDLINECVKHIKALNKVPDIIHGHYADAGYVGSKLSQILGVPFVFTGHSMGRSKLRTLIDLGVSEEAADAKYNIKRRIEAEEEAISTASLIVTSTKQEIEEQYSQYRCNKPKIMRVIPPGVDFSRFERSNINLRALASVKSSLGKFLRDLTKPMILAIARPDEKKNLHTLMKAFADDESLRLKSNLVIVAGQRSQLNQLESGPHQVWTTLINLMDDEDLYGSVAVPKTHSQDEIPAYMELAKLTGGVFVNPALTEPFGLTLLEAGAVGLPVVATRDGGPVEIIGKCRHGYLIDPLNPSDISEAIKKTIMDPDNWCFLSNTAAKRVQEHYSWNSHVTAYLKAVSPLLSSSDNGASCVPTSNASPH